MKVWPEEGFEIAFSRRKIGPQKGWLGSEKLTHVFKGGRKLLEKRYVKHTQGIVGDKLYKAKHCWVDRLLKNKLFWREHHEENLCFREISDTHAHKRWPPRSTFCWPDQGWLEQPCWPRSSTLTRHAWVHGSQISVSRFQISTFAVAARDWIIWVTSFFLAEILEKELSFTLTWFFPPNSVTQEMKALRCDLNYVIGNP